MSRQVSRGVALALALVTASAATAAIGIQIQTFPGEAVADGRSTIAVTLFVKNSDGSNVPDGTQILIKTTLGTFREPIVTTSSGIARAVLVAGNIAGTAKITATPLQNQSNPSTAEVEFVSDKSKLSSSNDFIEITASNSLEYTFAKKIVTASGPKQGVKFQFRDRLLEADDLQYIYDQQVVRAKNAKLKVGTKDYTFSEFYFDLRGQKGFGITQIDYVPIDRIRYFAGLLILERYNQFDERYEPTIPTRRTAVVAIGRSGISLPTEPVRPEIFNFVPIRDGIIAITDKELPSEKTIDYNTVRITAKRMTVVSRKEIQFQRADFYVGESKLFSQQLYRLDTMGMQGSFPTEQFVSFNDRQFSVNYPYYLSLERQQSRALRFRTGQSYGRGFTANRGVFFDLEQSWDKASGSGNFTVSGIGRDDYNIGVRHFARINDRTTASFAIDSPQIKSLFSTGTISHTGKGFSTSLSGSSQHALKGTSIAERQDYFLVAEKDPIKLGKMPVNLYYGVNANYSQSQTGTGTGFGARMRVQSYPITLDKSGASITAGLTFAQFAGNNVATPFASTANVSYNKQFGQKFGTTITYDYAKDGITEQALGLHRFSTQMYFDVNRFNASVFASKSIGKDAISLFADSSYRLADLWRVGYQYTLNRYSGTTFVDYSVVLAYRLRSDKPEFGISYSAQTKRVGFVLLGLSRN